MALGASISDLGIPLDDSSAITKKNKSKLGYTYSTGLLGETAQKVSSWYAGSICAL